MEVVGKMGRKEVRVKGWKQQGKKEVRMKLDSENGWKSKKGEMEKGKGEIKRQQRKEGRMKSEHSFVSLKEMQRNQPSNIPRLHILN